MPWTHLYAWYKNLYRFTYAKNITRIKSKAFKYHNKLYNHFEGRERRGKR